MSVIDLKPVDQILDQIGREPHKLIPILQAVQTQYGYLPQEALESICGRTTITPSQIMGVSTFYSQFRFKPVGQHIVRLCNGTACHVKGAEKVYQSLRRVLAIPEGDDTDPQGVFTVEKVACLGCCTLAPAVQIDEITYGHQTPESVERMLSDFMNASKKTGRGRKGIGLTQFAGQDGEIRIGLGSCCQARGSGLLHQSLLQSVEDLKIRATIKSVGCVGMCHQTPLVEIVKPDGRSFLYAQVEPKDARGILERHFEQDDLIIRWGHKAANWLDSLIEARPHEPVTRYSIDVRDKPVKAFLDKQINIATEHCGNISPVDLSEYLHKGGFNALKKCLTGMDPDQVIEFIRESGLRGRGGAGFLTGQKWRLVQLTKDDLKYIVCNGDEGDPGAFMDRMLLESYPLRVLEGMIIAAWAVGAHQGYLYIRAEYPLAVKRVREALAVCYEHGYLGKDILGSGFDLDLQIMEGAGAFVCGEETALLASIEGQRGMPRFRPPYPAEKGLFGKPTLVNNVETFCTVSWIIRQGAEAFGRLGTSSSAGAKVFALAGKVARGGLIEVPMGITIKEIVEEIGGGVADGRTFKAVQIGGPSGGCIPASMSHLGVDYEELAHAGAIMGSGGLVVLDDTDCMVDIARYFLEFTQDQSCGKCTPCRIGTRRMLEILERLCQGTASRSDLDELKELAISIKRSSLCGLGQTAPNPVLSTLEFFGDEYEAHLEGRCPAGKCTALITYSINDRCIGCTLCAQHCPVNAIKMKPYERHIIDIRTCIRCGGCKTICPVDAVEVK